MRTLLLITLTFAVTLLTGCGEKFELATDTDDFHYLLVEEAYLPIRVRGNTASGKILLFVQGGPGGSAIDFAEIDYPEWGNTLEAEYAVAYYDQRGTGNGQGTYDAESISFAQYIEDIDQIVRFLAEKYPGTELYLMGHSFGGYLTMRYMLDRGDDSPVAKYINLNGTASSDADPERWVFRRDWLLTIARERIAANDESNYWTEVETYLLDHPVLDTLDEWRFWNQTVEEKIYPNYEDPPITAGDAVDVLFTSPYNFFNTYLGYGHLDEVEQRLFDEWKAFRLVERLDEITGPLLILTGRYDDGTPPEEVQFIFDEISSIDKEMVVLPEAGHYSFYHQPELFMEAIRDWVE